MFRYSRIIVLFCITSWLLFSCNRVPDHRRYIPKDAALVAGINLKSLGKTIAWNMITGSKLFKEMQKKVPQNNGNDIMSGIDKAGIDALNTFYVYLKTDKRFPGGIKVTGLIPLLDAAQWEGYVKKNFPNSQVSTSKDIKTTSLGNNMYVGWNKNLLIVMNTISQPFGAIGTNNQPPQSNPEMAAEMDYAFTVTDENSIKQNEGFEKLEKVGHDITMWINYEQIMNQYWAENGNSGMGGVSLSPSIWKETALACGFDFKKGKITGDIAWHASKEMDSVYMEFGAVNANKDMIDRLPAKSLDMMLAMHLSTKGIKSLLDKTGLLGLANAGLSSQGMDADYILDAFSGDMAFTMNDLNMKFVDEMVYNQEQKGSAAMCYVIKINKKENFQKLMNMAKETGELFPYQKGYVVPLNPKDSLFLVYDDHYSVASNKYSYATSILDGQKTTDQLSQTIKAEAYTHPFNIYFDVQQALKNINLGPNITNDESKIYDESSKLLTNISLGGGEYKDHAMETHLEINFTNTEESSIFTLLDFGMKISDAVEKSRENRAQRMDSLLNSISRRQTINGTQGNNGQHPDTLSLSRSRKKHY